LFPCLPDFATRHYFLSHYPKAYRKLPSASPGNVPSGEFSPFPNFQRDVATEADLSMAGDMA
jgi:hypothetical protein